MNTQLIGALPYCFLGLTALVAINRLTSGDRRRGKVCRLKGEVKELLEDNPDIQNIVCVQVDAFEHCNRAADITRWFETELKLRTTKSPCSDNLKGKHPIAITIIISKDTSEKMSSDITIVSCLGTKRKEIRWDNKGVPPDICFKIKEAFLPHLVSAIKATKRQKEKKSSFVVSAT